MTATSPDVTLPPSGSTLVGVLLRNRVTLVAGVLVGMLFGALVSVLGTPVYEAQTILVVRPAASVDTRAAIRSIDILDNQNRLVLNSIAELAESPLARRESVARAGLDQGAGPYRIYGVLADDTNLIIVAADAHDPGEAKALSTTAAAVTIEEAARLLSAYRVEVLESATTPTSPSRPVVWVTSLAGSVIGAVAALAIVDLRLRTRRRR